MKKRSKLLLILNIIFAEEEDFTKKGVTRAQHMSKRKKSSSKGDALLRWLSSLFIEAIGF